MYKAYLSTFMGILGSVSVAIQTQAQTFESSNLPIVVINTQGQTIIDESKVNVHMGVIDNGPGNRNYYRNPQNNNQPDPFNNYDGTVGIEFRGSASQFFPKKPYGFETKENASSTKSVKAPILGMPPESDWILNASYTDKSLMRDVLTYHLSNQIGMYATRTRYVELVVDDDYKGVYIVMEKIKRDANRINIASLKETDNSGDAVTGGYILKIDKNTGTGNASWKSPYPGNHNTEINVMIEYPKQTNITEAQYNYIKNHFTEFENTLKSSQFKDPVNGYAKYIDVNSFVDYFLLTELTYNIDAFRLSIFMHKDRDSRNPKIKMGAPWDYDHSYGNANFCQGWETNHWAYDFVREFCPNDDKQVPFWWARLLEDRDFCIKVRDRWKQLRTNYWTNDYINTFIRYNEELLAESQVRNFQRWPILGEWVWPNYFVGKTFEEEVDWFKNWTEQRLQWLDTNIDKVGALGIDCSNVSAPTIASVSYCQGQNSNPLTAVGTDLKWYTSADTTQGSTLAPTPSTNTLGTTSYYVTQTTPQGCESPKAKLDVIINPVPQAPTVAHIEYCQEQSPNALSAEGLQLKWYSSLTSSSAETTAPIPATTTAGVVSYFVSQTIDGCESNKAEIQVTIKEKSTLPTIANMAYCEGNTATPLTASGQNLRWYTSMLSEDSTTTPPVPSTDKAQLLSFFVTQNTNGCESNRAEIFVNIKAKPTRPEVSDVGYCEGQNPNPLTAQGTDLKWYALETGGTGESTTPTFVTSSSTKLSYFVTQTIEGCESDRSKIEVTISPKPTPPQVENVAYCQQQKPSSLSAQGTRLRWYTSDIGSIGDTLAPLPTTNEATTLTYFVSQTMGGCESEKAKIEVVIKAKPDRPTLISTISYTKGDNAEPISAQGENLKWYATANATTSSLIAPVPSTSTTGDVYYYVTQTVNDCESDKAEVVISVFEPLASSVCLEIKAFLEGAMNGSSMTNILNKQGLLPGQTPSSAFAAKTPTGQPYSKGLWLYNGSEKVESYANDVVDWVLVSLRTSPLDEVTTVFKTAALIHQNGTIRPQSGCPSFDASHKFYVVVEHRNHIGAVSHEAVGITGGKISYDFTSQQSFIPPNAPSSGQTKVGNFYCLLAGDVQKGAFSEINARDSAIWLRENGKFGVYSAADMNLDGEVNAKDYSLWRRNNGKFSGIGF